MGVPHIVKVQKSDSGLVNKLKVAEVESAVVINIHQYIPTEFK